MKNFNVSAIAGNIKENKSVSSFMEVISESKLNHFTLAKAVLVLFHLVQTDPELQEMEKL